MKRNYYVKSKVKNDSERLCTFDSYTDYVEFLREINQLRKRGKKAKCQAERIKRL